MTNCLINDLLACKMLTTTHSAIEFYQSMDAFD